MHDNDEIFVRVDTHNGEGIEMQVSSDWISTWEVYYKHKEPPLQQGPPLAVPKEKESLPI
jgi:hypothetical protein